MVAKKRQEKRERGGKRKEANPASNWDCAKTRNKGAGSASTIYVLFGWDYLEIRSHIWKENFYLSTIHIIVFR
jgi:hypothetical protein